MELNVAGLTWWPFIRVFSREINGKNVTTLDQETLIGKIMITLSQQLNFNYTLSSATYWGIMDKSSKDLKFDGMVGMIQNDEVDLALGPFTIERGDRDLVGDPSTVIMEDIYTLLSSGKSDVSKRSLGVSLLTKSFETNVWYSILLTLIIIILFSSSINYIWKKPNKTSHVIEKNFIKILIRNSFEHSGNLISQCNDLNSHHLPEILKYCWKLSSFLLILFYSSMILVHLIASNKKNIDTFHDLSNSQVITTTASGSTTEIIIREGKTDDLKTIYFGMIKHGLHNSVLSLKKTISEEIMEEILLGKRALLASVLSTKSTLSERVMKKRTCGFYISKSELYHEPQFMLYNKKFDKKLKEKIDSRLLEMFERKPFDWKIERYFSRYEECLDQQANSQWKQLKLFNIRGLLLVCLIIIILSFIALSIELFQLRC